MKKPNRKTIENMINYFSEIGLTVYGPNMDAESGEEFCSLMDYTADEIILRAKHIKNDTLWDSDCES